MNNFQLLIGTSQWFVDETHILRAIVHSDICCDQSIKTGYTNVALC